MSVYVHFFQVTETAGRCRFWGCHTGEGLGQEENEKRIFTSDPDYTVFLDAGYVV